MTSDLLTQLGDICAFAAVTMLAGAIGYALLDIRRTSREWRTTDSAIKRIGRQSKLGLRERLGGTEIAQRRAERR
jgi:hypothetical protein